MTQQQEMLRALRRRAREAWLRAPAPRAPSPSAISLAAQWRPWEQGQQQVQRALTAQAGLMKQTRALAAQLQRATEAAERERVEVGLQARALDSLLGETHQKIARAADAAAQHATERAQAAPPGGSSLGWVQAGLAAEASTAAHELERQVELANRMRQVEEGLSAPRAATALAP
jgi:hypothetical protein